MLTLEELIARHGEPAFVRIDVEGYEREALDGLTRAVPALSFEYLSATRDAGPACLDRLDALGDYRYAFSRGETHRLEHGRWRERVLVRVRHQPNAGPSYSSAWAS